MGSDNTILTALGLDTTQFEQGTNRAVGATKVLAQALNSVDSELRKIPIVGEIYTATFGKIATGFAESREQAREFARIMSTDVSGSLTGTVAQIDEITEALKKLREPSFGRKLADTIKDVATFSGGVSRRVGLGEALGHPLDWLAGRAGKTMASAGAGLSEFYASKQPSVFKFDSEADKRAKQDAGLAQKREDNLKRITALTKQEAEAHSSILSGSQQLTEETRAQMGLRDRIVSIQQRSREIFGPDQEEKRTAYVKEQSDLAQANIDKEKEAIGTRFQIQEAERASAQKQAAIENNSQESVVKLTEEQYALAQKRYELSQTLSQEEKMAASAELQVAGARLELAKFSVNLENEQIALVTKAMDAQVKGQTRALNQAKIREQYETRIAEAMRHGTAEQVKQLQAQEKLARLTEAIRLYSLGGRGRAAERLAERRAGRTVRTVEERAAMMHRDAPDGGLHSGGLVSGGLGGGHPRALPKAVKVEYKERLTTAEEAKTMFAQLMKVLSQ